MAKAKRLIQEKINRIDVVYEVIDSRIPYSSKIKDIDTFIKNKKKLLIFTKYDLCDKQETNKWVEYYENLGYKTVCIDPTTNISKIINATKELMEEQNKNRIEKGLNIRKTRVLIVGIPNAGKSTLINKLVGKKVASVGNKPGVTKSLDWIRINDQLELLDTPGILWPKIDDEEVGYNLASLTAIKEEILPREEVVCYILKKLYNEYPNILKERYSLTELDEDFIIAFDTIGKKRGCLVKGGEVDYDKVCDVVMNDVKEGYIKNITFDKFSKRN
jgi:ribosome biogenesis GTPase A